MKKILLSFLLVSSLCFGNYKTIEFTNYKIKPNYIKQSAKNKYVFSFEIKYKPNQIGFEHDVKLMTGEQYLASTVENIVNQFYSDNNNALVELYIPQGYENMKFDGVGILDRKTNEVIANFKIKQ